jgi:drug/metabolite transporter (DMT)-like permease
MEQEKLVPGAGTWFFSAWMMAMRFSFGALVLLPWMWRGGIRREELRQGLTLALWGGVGMWFQSDALGHTSASVSAFLTQGYCVFLPLWFALRHRHRPDGRTSLATAMVVLGVARLSGVTPSELRLGRGEWETLVAAFLFTFQILALGDPRYEGNRSLRVTFVMFAGVAVIFWPIAFVAAPPQPGACLAVGASWPVAGLLAALTILSTLGAYLLMNHFQRGVTATEAGLIYCCEPVFTAVYVLWLPAWLGSLTGNAYANEVWTASFLAGAGLITAANIVMQWRRA